MSDPSQSQLSRRERQIMDILYQRGRATVAEIREGMFDPPSYSTVRALLRIIEEKGHVRHRQEGARYVYAPKRRRSDAARAALKRVLHTFFDGSPERAVATLLEISDKYITTEELDRLSELVEEAKREGR